MELINAQYAACHPLALQLARVPGTPATLAAFAVAHCKDEQLLDTLDLLQHKTTDGPTAHESTFKPDTSNNPVTTQHAVELLEKAIMTDAGGPGLPDCGLGPMALGAALALPIAQLERVCQDAPTTSMQQQPYAQRVLLVASVAACIQALRGDPTHEKHGGSIASMPPSRLWELASNKGGVLVDAAARFRMRLEELRAAETMQRRVGAAAQALEDARAAGGAAGSGQEATSVAHLLQHDNGDESWSAVAWEYLSALLTAMPANRVPPSAKEGINAAVRVLGGQDAGRLQQQLLQQVLPRIDGTDAAHMLVLLRVLAGTTQDDAAAMHALIEFVRRTKSAAVNYKIMLQAYLDPTPQHVGLVFDELYAQVEESNVRVLAAACDAAIARAACVAQPTASQVYVMLACKALPDGVATLWPRIVGLISEDNVRAFVAYTRHGGPYPLPSVHLCEAKAPWLRAGARVALGDDDPLVVALGESLQEDEERVLLRLVDGAVGSDEAAPIIRRIVLNPAMDARPLLHALLARNQLDAVILDDASVALGLIEMLADDTNDRDALQQLRMFVHHALGDEELMTTADAQWSSSGWVPPPREAATLRRAGFATLAHHDGHEALSPPASLDDFTNTWLADAGHDTAKLAALAHVMATTAAWGAIEGCWTRWLQVVVEAHAYELAIQYAEHASADALQVVDGVDDVVVRAILTWLLGGEVGHDGALPAHHPLLNTLRGVAASKGVLVDVEGHCADDITAAAMAVLLMDKGLVHDATALAVRVTGAWGDEVLERWIAGWRRHHPGGGGEGWQGRLYDTVASGVS